MMIRRQEGPPDLRSDQDGMHAIILPVLVYYTNTGTTMILVYLLLYTNTSYYTTTTTTTILLITFSTDTDHTVL